MKCSIITIHHIHNFGSVFQAWALEHFLLGNGLETEIIDYRPSYYEAGRNKLKTLVGKALNIRSYTKRKRKFDNFIKERDIISSQCFHTIRELQDYYTNIDNLFIAGGDQLWNDYHPCGSDDSYKLSFTDSKRKIAYGTSMGRDNYSQDELERLALKVHNFSRIMLRERNTVELLKPHIDVPVDHVIDPVGLIDIEDFRRIAVKPRIEVPYAVMYLADSGELLDKTVEFLSQKLGLKIVHICGFKKKCYCDYFEKDVGPEEILGYILYADFVLSASFHATMFSLLFNKQFATLLPGKQTNARIEDILSYVGLSNRIIHNEQELVNIEQTIDFANANVILTEFRENSRTLLKKVLREMVDYKE
jgi:hypothetical protein